MSDTAQHVDITVGEVRVVIAPTGLIGLHRGDDEHLTLVPSEAVTIARVLLERLGKLGLLCTAL